MVNDRKPSKMSLALVDWKILGHFIVQIDEKKSREGATLHKRYSARAAFTFCKVTYGRYAEVTVTDCNADLGQCVFL